MPDTKSPKVTMSDENFPAMEGKASENPSGRRWTCPDDQTIAEYIDGALRENRKARIEFHLAKCAYCRHIVADVVKLIRLVNPPAPDAQHVRAGIDGLLDALANPCRIAGAIEKAIVGDPVEAFTEDRLAVDFDDEL